MIISGLKNDHLNNLKKEKKMKNLTYGNIVGIIIMFIGIITISLFTLFDVGSVDFPLWTINVITTLVFFVIILINQGYYAMERDSYWNKKYWNIEKWHEKKPFKNLFY
jgi:amino acid permease